MVEISEATRENYMFRGYHYQAFGRSHHGPQWPALHRTLASLSTEHRNSPYSHYTTPTTFITKNPTVCTIVDPSGLLCRGPQQILPLRKATNNSAAAELPPLPPLNHPCVTVPRATNEGQ
jgi:hypothetical protein